MNTKVAINGLGRIGRAILKLVIDEPGLDLVAVNDLVEAENLAYLLRFDTVYGRFPKPVVLEGGHLTIAGHKVRTLQDRDPLKLRWKDLGVELVFECTGALKRREDLEKHIQAGARFVLLSAPSQGVEVETVVHGANAPQGASGIISCASCTTNCITPIVEVIGRRIGIKKAVMTTVHAYTSSQSIIDGPSKAFRRGRAAAANLVLATTGAALATTRALPEYTGLFDGIAIRAPLPVGSIADLTFVASRRTSVEEVNRLVLQGMPFRDAYKKIGAAIEGNNFTYSTHLQHSHEGSLSNLQNKEIAHMMDTVLSRFNFDKVNSALNSLLL